MRKTIIPFSLLEAKIGYVAIAKLFCLEMFFVCATNKEVVQRFRGGILEVVQCEPSRSFGEILNVNMPRCLSRQDTSKELTVLILLVDYVRELFVTLGTSSKTVMRLRVQKLSQRLSQVRNILLIFLYCIPVYVGCTGEDVTHSCIAGS